MRGMPTAAKWAYLQEVGRTKWLLGQTLRGGAMVLPMVIGASLFVDSAHMIHLIVQGGAIGAVVGMAVAYVQLRSRWNDWESYHSAVTRARHEFDEARRLRPSAS